MYTQCSWKGPRDRLTPQGHVYTGLSSGEIPYHYVLYQPYDCFKISMSTTDRGQKIRGQPSKKSIVQKKKKFHVLNSHFKMHTLHHCVDIWEYRDKNNCACFLGT